MGLANSRQAWNRTLAGIQTGEIAGAAMLGWFLLHSMWAGERWWAIPNLLATTFYGERALRLGLGGATVSGAALHFLVAGLVGFLFALVVTRWRSNPLGISLLGVFAGIFWYYLSYGLLWRRVNPLVPVYGASPAMLTGHLLFGVCLSLYPRWLARVERSQEQTGDSQPIPKAGIGGSPRQEEADGEVSNGVSDIQHAEAPGVPQHHGPPGDSAAQERDPGRDDPGVGDAHHGGSLGE